MRLNHLRSLAASVTSPLQGRAIAYGQCAPQTGYTSPTWGRSASEASRVGAPKRNDLAPSQFTPPDRLTSLGGRPPLSGEVLDRVCRDAHNYLGFPFTLGVVLIFLMWIAWNLPTRVDVEWLKQGGGIVGHRHPPAYRFNAGQKMIYWIVVLGGGAVAASGYLLMFPFYVTDITGMQVVQVIHGVVAVLFVAVMLAHIYIGTIGMEGAFEGMWDGSVDVNWAKEHHSLWVNDEMQKTATPAPRHAAATPAE
jgi:formate dehydrogenase gamma subunit